MSLHYISICLPLPMLVWFQMFVCVCVASDGKNVQGEKCSPALPCSGSSHLEKRTIPAVISTSNIYIPSLSTSPIVSVL